MSTEVVWLKKSDSPKDESTENRPATIQSLSSETPCKIQETTSQIESVPSTSSLIEVHPIQLKAITFCEQLNVLEPIKLHLKIVGCLPIEPNELPKWCRKIPFNRIHIGCVSMILILNFVCTIWFYVGNIHSFADFSESVFWSSRCILSLALYGSFIWYKERFVQLFDDLQAIVNNRMTQI